MSARVLFRRWLAERGISYAQAGRVLGVSGEAVRLWCAGRRSPDWIARLAIDSWTDGRIHERAWCTADERRRLARAARIVPWGVS